MPGGEQGHKDVRKERERKRGEETKQEKEGKEEKDRRRKDKLADRLWGKLYLEHVDDNTREKCL